MLCLIDNKCLAAGQPQIKKKSFSIWTKIHRRTGQVFEGRAEPDAALILIKKYEKQVLN